ncbi:hypothetical protein ACK8P5_20450 [Paenibacillus sp. EC2-1]
MEWVESIREEVSVTQVRKWIGVPRATYYRWIANLESKYETIW